MHIYTIGIKPDIQVTEMLIGLDIFKFIVIFLGSRCFFINKNIISNYYYVIQIFHLKKNTHVFLMSRFV
jgi:hypothetical protein